MSSQYKNNKGPDYQGLYYLVDKSGEMSNRFMDELKALGNLWLNNLY